MDYDQSIQMQNSPEFFSVGQGVNNPNINNFESENNLNIENWNVTPDKNPSAVGNKAISSALQNENNPLPLPSSEIPSMPSEVYNPTSENLAPSTVGTNSTPELGQIVSMEPAPLEKDVNRITQDQSKEELISSFTWKRAMSKDRLSNAYIQKFDKSIKELDDTDDIAAFVDFWASAGENFRNRNASLDNSKEAA